MKACFDACCVHGGAQGYLVTPRWPGALSGAIFPTKIQAVDALVSLLPKPRDSKPEWEGKPLYPNKAKTRTNPLYPRLAIFPSRAPAGAFLAHYDEAGGGRPYGLHPGSKLSTKLQAAYDVIAKMKDRGKQGGSKAVVFSESVRALSLLRDAVASGQGRGKAVKGGGDEAVALIDGAMAQERRARRDQTFHHRPGLLRSIPDRGRVRGRAHAHRGRPLPPAEATAKLRARAAAGQPGELSIGLYLAGGLALALVCINSSRGCICLQPNAGRELQLVNRVSLA
jgi:hypothetical protein